MEKVSFVIPCYRSQNTLPGVVDEIDLAMNNLPQYKYEIILVDDCSPDETYRVICKLSKNNANITGISMSRNFGQHAALMAGFHYATGETIVCLDDDGQTPADEVGKLLEKINAGYDVVYASYEQKMHNPFRNFGSAVNSKMAEFMLGKPRGLFMSSYFAMRRFVMLEMLRYVQCYPYISGLLLRSTQNICNVTVTHRKRQQGESGYTFGKLISLWMNGFTSFSLKPLRMAVYFGFLFAVLGFVYLAVVVVRHFLVATSVLGWSSVISTLLLMGGIILIVLGLIGEYVGRIYMCVNAAPQYVIREVTHEGQNEENL